MNKIVKILMGVVGIVVVLVFIIPFLIGFLGALDPKKAIEYGKQNSTSYSNLYVPTGYEVEKLAEWDQAADIFVTRMTNGKNEIVLIQSPKNNTACNGRLMPLGDNQVCFMAKGTVTTLTNHKVYTWSKLDKFYQLNVDDGAIEDETLKLIIDSIN